MTPSADSIVPLRHYGRWVAGAFVVGLVVLLVRAFARADIDWAVVREFFMAPVLIAGLGNALLITVLATTMGLVLGVAFAVMRLSRNPVTNAVAAAYIWLFRGTPVYLQLLIWFNLALVFPTVNLGVYQANMVDVMTPFLAALLGLGINEGAYMTEIVRGGILSVDRGQLDAASALGMTRLLAMRRIVLPQALRVVVPPIGNEFIGLLKTSSMASAIAFSELLQRSQQIYFVNGKVIELLIVAAGWYLIVVTIFSVVQSQVERLVARGQGHDEPPSWLGRLWRNIRTTRADTDGVTAATGGTR
ncbi:MAG: amino acid ABC transporter permease [Gemmatimonadaceae bacterium]